MGFGAGGVIGHVIEISGLSNIEKESQRINFQELSAKDPDVVVIPYSDILLKNNIFVLSPPNSTIFLIKTRIFSYFR